MTRQKRLERLVARYWKTGSASPTLPPSHPSAPKQREDLAASFRAAEYDLAEYVAHNVKRITVRSGK